MQNLYDVLDVRPDDDAETLKSAFRKAAKATHPDHHGDDPHAAVRFGQISQAYEILRDAEQRAAYDRLLEFERRPLRHKVKWFVSGMKRHVVHDVIIGAVLAVMLAVGYELFTAVTARESGQAAADHPVERIGVAERDRPERMLPLQMTVAMPTALTATAFDHDRPETTNGKPVSNPAGRTTAVASQDTNAARVPRKTEGEPPIQHDMPFLYAPFSASEERNGIPAVDDKREGEAPKPPGVNTGVTLPEIKTSVHASAAEKRHSPSRPRFEREQAALENRNIPASDGGKNVPSRPFFGVGF
jgi:hypothetical protein